ncbi:hypothetical protein C2S53_005906 [Perilla frutescens var. hirtella]|uniref:SOSEKI DIX-like domain-containing protein n=1 Tax=Perilla frutescens var. hirtella TaxID=608512 RepID=A0AAD4INE5_PERFH|nr:hypothetical protein C2S53_005906 [Perilla frutescens var. hirtella]KAH6812281.1 hypothetical protein C2S51_026043 [Perilla frutescens var. frutescens]
MPESFAWSYKRKYKTGYVWQDILDDDLITPISDNEYVLKGSEISSTNDNIDFSRIPMQKEQPSLQKSAKDSQRASSKEGENDIHSSISSSYVSSKTSSSLEQSSPSFESETSTSTDKNLDRFNQEANSPASESTALLNKEKKRKTNKLEIINAKSISKTAAASSDHKPHHRKSQSGGVLRNLITCGGVHTHDSVVMKTNKRYKPFLKTCSCDSADGVRDPAKEKGEYTEHRAPRAAYRPLYGPKCSQCGKGFIPEKLQSHMNSCKGMKALAKGSNPAVSAAHNISKTSTASRNEDAVSAYLLTQNC